MLCVWTSKIIGSCENTVLWDEQLKDSSNGDEEALLNKKQTETELYIISMTLFSPYSILSARVANKQIKNIINTLHQSSLQYIKIAA